MTALSITPPETSHSLKRVKCLDGIRGMAILFVLCGHISNTKSLIFEGDGEFGVWLFFVLSSFLLSLYFFQQPERMRSSREWANYALRRFLRIYPAYTLALITGIYVGTWRLKGAIAAFTLQDPAYWAVFVEFRYYLALPFVVAAFHLLGRMNRSLPPALMAMLMCIHMLIFPKSSTFPGYLVIMHPWKYVPLLFWEYFIVFVIGTFTAWCYVHTQQLRPLLAKSRLLDACVLIATLVPWLASPLIVQSFSKVPEDYYHLDWLPWSALFAAIIYGVMMTDGFTRRLYESKFLRMLGYISFSLYLFMDFIINPLKDAISNPAAFVIAAASATLLLASVTFILIERPLSRITLLRKPRSLAFAAASLPPGGTPHALDASAER